MSAKATPVPRMPSGSIASADSHDQSEPGSCSRPMGVTTTSATQLRAEDDRQRAVLLRQRHGHIRGEPVVDTATSASRAPSSSSAPASSSGTNTSTMPAKPSADADELAPARQLAQQVGGPGDGEDGHRAVDHPGHARGDPLLRDGEQQQRDGHPDDAEEGDAGQSSRSIGCAGPREERQRTGAEGDASHGDDAGRERAQPDLHEQERRAPDERDGGQQAPVAQGRRRARSSRSRWQAATNASSSPGKSRPHRSRARTLAWAGHEGAASSEAWLPGSSTRYYVGATRELQHGQDLDGVTVVDPFVTRPGELLPA